MCHQNSECGASSGPCWRTGGPEGSSFSDSVEGALNEIGGCGNEGQLQRTMPNGCLPCSPGMW